MMLGFTFGLHPQIGKLFEKAAKTVLGAFSLISFFLNAYGRRPARHRSCEKKNHQFVLLCHLTLDFSVSVCHVNLSTSNIYVLEQPDCQHLFRDRFWAKELNCTHQAHVLRSRLKSYLNKRRSAYAIGTLSSYITTIALMFAFYGPFKKSSATRPAACRCLSCTLPCLPVEGVGFFLPTRAAYHNYRWRWRNTVGKCETGCFVRVFGRVFVMMLKEKFETHGLSRNLYLFIF